MRKFRITYETPFGAFENWLEASDRCQQADLDPVAAIKIIRTEVA